MKAFRLLTIAVLLGCGSPSDPQTEAAPLLVTDATEYEVRRGSGGFEVQIGYSYSNESGTDVLLSNCNGFVGPSLEKFERGRWDLAWSPIEALCLSVPIEIKVGSEYRDTLHVVAFDRDTNAGPEFLLETVPGIYRLIWFRASWKSEGPGVTTSMPERFRVSNPFRLTYP